MRFFKKDAGASEPLQNRTGEYQIHRRRPGKRLGVSREHRRFAPQSLGELCLRLREHALGQVVPVERPDAVGFQKPAARTTRTTADFPDDGIMRTHLQKPFDDAVDFTVLQNRGAFVSGCGAIESIAHPGFVRHSVFAERSGNRLGTPMRFGHGREGNTRFGPRPFLRGRRKDTVVLGKNGMNLVGDFRQSARPVRRTVGIAQIAEFSTE